MTKTMIYPVEQCRGCPLHETGKDCDKYTNWETVTVHRCWHKKMDGKTIPDEIWKEGYEEFPDWCPLEERDVARIELLDELITHFKKTIENGKGVTYNHPITYQWMYGGIVTYLEELRKEGDR